LLTREKIMAVTQILAIAIAIILLLGFIASEISRKAYERGNREGWSRGRAVNRQEFWAE
jgi:hypothetical protein